MNAVIYVSRGGNTKKLAEAIAKGAGVQAQSIANVADLPRINILFVGASIYAGKISGELHQFLQTLGPNHAAQAVVFGTSAGGKSALAEIKSLLEPKNIPVSEEAFCRKGSFLFLNLGRPNAGDLAQAEDFARRVCAGT
jgi:flavorubredoxin